MEEVSKGSSLPCFFIGKCGLTRGSCRTKIKFGIFRAKDAKQCFLMFNYSASAGVDTASTESAGVLSASAESAGVSSVSGSSVPLSLAVVVV